MTGRSPSRIACFTLLFVLCTPMAAAAPDLANSVVKVFSTMRYPDPFKPWTKQAPTEATGSGVIIEGKRIQSGPGASQRGRR